MACAPAQEFMRETLLLDQENFELTSGWSSGPYWSAGRSLGLKLTDGFLKNPRKSLWVCGLQAHRKCFSCSCWRRSQRPNEKKRLPLRYGLLQRNKNTFTGSWRPPTAQAWHQDPDPWTLWGLQDPVHGSFGVNVLLKKKSVCDWRYSPTARIISRQENRKVGLIFHRLSTFLFN